MKPIGYRPQAAILSVSLDELQMLKAALSCDLATRTGLDRTAATTLMGEIDASIEAISGS